MIISARPLGILVAFIFILAAAPVSASYVLYYRIIGDWTVLCSEEGPRLGRQCTLSAPPPSLDLLGGRNELVIEETAPDTFRVAVQVRQVARQGAKVTVKIDDFPAYEAAIAAGSAVWTDDDATMIMRQGLAGQILVVSVETSTGDREMRLSLIGFSKAIQAYRRVVRSLGPL